MSKIKVNEIENRTGSTLTLGKCGSSVNLATGATQSGFGRTGTVDWCTTAKTSPLTGVSGKGYFINTTGGAVTVTLPASPSAGDIVSIADYAGTAGSNKITIGRNSSKFEGSCTDGAINEDREAITLIYVDGTQGWVAVSDNTEIKTNKEYVTATGGTVITSGDHKTHIFTGTSALCVSSAGNAAGSNTVDYFVIGGGGSAAGFYFGGGGGAGGFRMSNSLSLPSPATSPLANPAGLPVSATSYPITIGGGSTAPNNGSTSPTVGTSGNVSTFSSITSAGGGGGGNEDNDAVAGASGGGSGGYNTPSPRGPGGAGNTPPVSPPQGNTGGAGGGGSVPTGSAYGAGGGGGGAVGVGSRPGLGTGGAGSYVSDDFFGPTAPSYGTPGPVSSTRYFAGGGGGGLGPGGPPCGDVPGGIGLGGSGGGANGRGPANSPTYAGFAGTANTGGGGGGTGNNSPASNGGKGGTGGSGFIAIRYKFQN